MRPINSPKKVLNQEQIDRLIELVDANNNPGGIADILNEEFELEFKMTRHLVKGKFGPSHCKRVYDAKSKIWVEVDGTTASEDSETNFSPSACTPKKTKKAKTPPVKAPEPYDVPLESSSDNIPLTQRVLRIEQQLDSISAILKKPKEKRKSDSKALLKTYLDIYAAKGKNNSIQVNPRIVDLVSQYIEKKHPNIKLNKSKYVDLVLLEVVLDEL